MRHKATAPSRDKRHETAKLNLQEFRRRLAQAAANTVSFHEQDSCGKPTNRLALPRAFCAAFDRRSHSGRVTLSFEGQLVLVPAEVWEEYLEETRAELTNIGCSSFVDEFIRNSHPVQIDGKGRVTLAKRLAKEAGLKDDVLLCPGRAIEIWDEKTYGDYRQKVRSIVSAKVGFPITSQNGSPQT